MLVDLAASAMTTEVRSDNPTLERATTAHNAGAYRHVAGGVKGGADRVRLVLAGLGRRPVGVGSVSGSPAGGRDQDGRAGCRRTGDKWGGGQAGGGFLARQERAELGDGGHERGGGHDGGVLVDA